MSKNKPFDLEAAKAGKPVQTARGNKVRHLCFDYKNPNGIYTIVGIELMPDGSECIINWRDNGQWGEMPSANDLVMAPEIIEYWVNVYSDCLNGVYLSRVTYPSKEVALLNVGHVRSHIKTIKIHEEEI